MPSIPYHEQIDLAVWVKYQGWPWWPVHAIKRAEGISACSEAELRKLPSEAPNNAMVQFFEADQQSGPVEVVEAHHVREFVSSCSELLRSAKFHKDKILFRAADWIQNLVLYLRV